MWVFRRVGQGLAGAMVLSALMALPTAPTYADRDGRTDRVDVTRVVDAPLDDDVTAPTVSADVSNTIVFPARDGYRDHIKITASADEPARFELWTWPVDPDTPARRVAHTDAMAAGRTVRWTTRFRWYTDDEDRVLSGDRVFEVRAIDEAGNVGSAQQVVEVDAARTLKVTAAYKLLPAKYIYAKSVGRCSSLKRPSSHRWRGSLGYYSQTKCRARAKGASDVVVWHAAWLPMPLRRNDYHRIWIDGWGGAARHQRSAYAVFGLWDKKDHFHRTHQWTKRVGWHTGAATRDKRFVRYQDGRPYLMWSVGLTDGSRFDVKKFGLWVEYTALIEPDGKVLSGDPVATPRASTPSSAYGPRRPALGVLPVVPEAFAR